METLYGIQQSSEDFIPLDINSEFSLFSLDERTKNLFSNYLHSGKTDFFSEHTLKLKNWVCGMDLLNSYLLIDISKKRYDCVLFDSLDDSILTENSLKSMVFPSDEYSLLNDNFNNFLNSENKISKDELKKYLFMFKRTIREITNETDLDYKDQRVLLQTFEELNFSKFFNSDTHKLFVCYFSQRKPKKLNLLIPTNVYSANARKKELENINLELEHNLKFYAPQYFKNMPKSSVLEQRRYFGGLEFVRAIRGGTAIATLGIKTRTNHELIHYS